MENEYIRKLKKIDEISELVNVQKEIWGFDDIDIIPVHMLADIPHLLIPEGLILGYFIDKKLVGFLFTLPRPNPKEVLLDILGVLPDFQRKNIGYNLMLELRKSMLDLDVDKIFWTYDPLESVNANLYIRKLGGNIISHFIDYYGDIKSTLYSGIPTDRFEVEWNIRSKHVENRIIRTSKIDQISENECMNLVEIPLNIQELKNKDMNIALNWRMKTRKLFDEYIEKQNMVGIDFIYDEINKKGTYIFI